jgi:clan AA aspartic protease (TIGR02281 family)
VPKVVKPTVETRGGEDQDSAPSPHGEHERNAPPEEPIEHVAMTKTLAGVFVVAAEINGIKLDFMVDSGAATVMVPAGVLERMRRDGTVTNEDILDPQIFTIADGTHRTWTAFMIRSLKVGGVVVQNIRGGAIESSERITPLLGQSFLARLQSWSIDNARLELVIEPSGQREAAKKPPAKAAVPWGPRCRTIGPRLSPCSLALLATAERFPVAARRTGGQSLSTRSIIFAMATLIERAKSAGFEALKPSPTLGDFNEDVRYHGVDDLRARLRAQLVAEDGPRFIDGGCPT